MSNEVADKEAINPDFTYIEVGVRIRIPSARWAAAGVKVGDFLRSTTLTDAVNSPEKIMAALKAPSGTVLAITRGDKRIDIPL